MSLKARLKDNRTACRCDALDLRVLGVQSWVTGVRARGYICECEYTRIHMCKDAKGPPWMTFLTSHPHYFSIQCLSLDWNSASRLG